MAWSGTSRARGSGMVAAAHGEPQCAISLRLLGGRFHFTSDHRALLALVEAAYGGLPQPPEGAAVDFQIRLQLLMHRRRRYFDQPPPLQTTESSGVLRGEIDACNYALVSPANRRALIVVSEEMLEHARMLRQEMIEFAVLILAARCLRLVPLHAACCGAGDRGILLLGESGAGKSTLALHSMLQGMELLSEDAVFVQPQGMSASGIPNFLRVRVDAPDFENEPVQRWIRQSPVIRRRSGVRKFEADLRRGPGRLTAGPLRLCAAVLISDEKADDPRFLLQPLAAAEIEPALAGDQAYAATQPEWTDFVHGLQRLGVYRLRRGRDPEDGVAALRRLLD